MKKQLDELNVKISGKETEYKTFMTTIPVDVVSRSAEDEAKRSAMFDEYELLNNQGVVLRKAYEDDLKLRAFTAEHNARQADQTSGAEYRSVATPGAEVMDKAIYPNPEIGLGQQLQDVVIQARGLRDYTPDQIQRACGRLEKCENRRQHLISRAADPATQMEKIPSLGGIALETERSRDLIEIGFNNSELAKRCTRRRMSSITGKQEIWGVKGELSRKDGSRNGSAGWYPIDELDQIMRSQVEYENKITIQTTKVGAGYNASAEIVRDIPFLTGEINGKFKNEWAFDVQKWIYEGIGGKEPMVGVKNAKSKIIVPKFGTQAAGTFVWENMIAMWKAMYGGGFGNAFWVKSKQLEDQLLTLQIDTGDTNQLAHAYKPARSPELPSTLYGHTAITIEQADVPGTVGDIAFLDLSQYIVTDKGSMTAASSTHVEFWSDQWAFKFTNEIDGQSRWTDVAKSYKGDFDEAPYIFLATRAAA